MRLRLWFAWIALLLVPGAGRAEDAVRVASKPDTEGSLLGSVIIRSLEADGIRTVNRVGLGPTKIVRAALLAGQVDVYPEYTGNGAFFFSRESDPAWRDLDRGLDLVRRLDEANRVVWLRPAPVNNSWAIAVRGEVARARHLATLADFARDVNAGGAWKLAASAEFVESKAALPSFESVYGFHLTGAQLLILVGGNTSVTLRAAAEGTSGVNAAMAYGTDGALSALGMVVLDDPKSAQLLFAPAPVIRAPVLNAHPRIGPVLDAAFAKLDGPTLRKLNARIAVEGDDPAQVAEDFLRDAGLPH